MRLRTSESFWLLKNGLPYTYPSLRTNISTQMVVLGGGITGALISHALLDAGFQTILLDKRDIGTGSTAATTSMLQYEIDVPLYQLIAQIGERPAVTCYKHAIEAIHDLERLIKSEKIECGFTAKKSLYLAHNRKAAGWLYEEYKARKRFLEKVQWLSPETIRQRYGIHCSGGILSQVAASVDAYKLAHELIHNNTRRGLQVYDQTEISHVDYGKRKIKINTADGAVIRCDKIIYCTGYETTTMFKEQIARLFVTYACVSEEQLPLPKKLKDLLIWNTEEPYLYMRTTDDNRLLIGGLDRPFSNRGLSYKTKEEKSGLLIKKLGKIIPGFDFIEDFSWGGVFGASADGLPYIGTHPKYPNAIFVLGFGGNGIVFSVQAMQLVTDILNGGDNELLHFYRFGR
jgi:glycine/D-amino acid oxidase-like deaminating enzyme